MATPSVGIDFVPVTTREIPAYRNKRVWVVWLALGGAALSKAMLIEGVSIGDVLFGCAAVACLLSRFKGRRLLYVPRWSIYIVFLLIWAVAGGFFARSYSFFAFSEVEFWKSFAKLIFYGIGAILLGSHFRDIGIDAISKVVLTFLTLNALIALYIYGAQVVDQISTIHLPHEFFWFGQGGPLTIGQRLSPRVIKGGIILNKARGVFSEPANFGIFQTLGLAFLYFRASMPVNRFTWKQIVILTSLLLTFSLSVYGLLVTLSVAWALKQKQVRQWKTMLKAILGVAVVTTLAFSLAPASLSGALQEAVFHRLVSATQLQDRTSVARLIGSWDVARAVVSDSPLFGSGLGNLEFAFLGSGKGYSSLVSQETLTVTIRGSAAAFNILFAVLGSLGIVGFFIFFLLIAHLIIGSPAASIVFLVSTFATGIFLGPVFWVYYVLLATCVRG